MTDQISGLENARPGKWRTKSHGWKMQDRENDGPKRWKMTDQIAGLESAGLENDGPNR